MLKKTIFSLGAAVGLSLTVACSKQERVQAVQLDNDDIGGLVISGAGPEAGVWVIAETEDLATSYKKIVVTDDKGRYVIPDLPDANYRIWVRGYGLTDSTAVESTPGNVVNLTAKTATTAKEAAHYYPANYWLSLLQPPEKSEFPGTGAAGNGIMPVMRSQTDWIYHLKENCMFCHQLGNEYTRTLSRKPTPDSTSKDSWIFRVFGAGEAKMSEYMGSFGHERAAAMFADWTDRIEAGELPEAPPRPSGVERNMVITLWDWAIAPDGTPEFVHDEISTDQRAMTVNADGKIYGVAQFAGRIAWLNPNNHTHGLSEQIPTSFSHGRKPNSAEPHNPMMDAKGRIWSTSFSYNPDQHPDWCKPGSDNPFAQFYPMKSATGRPSQVSVYDPVTEEIKSLETCFGSHHLQFGYDSKDTLYLTGDVNVMGWVETKTYDKTGSSEAAVGWCPMIIDTNGNGKMEVGVDKQINGFLYGMGVNPRDDSAWYARYTHGASGYGSLDYAIPGGIIRLTRGDAPPQTCLVELFSPPVPEDRERIEHFNPRGVDVGSDGIAWTAFGSGHLGRFDRSKCRNLHDSVGDGQHCPEGWKMYKVPGPQFKGVDRDGAADWHYLTWVDEFNVLGLGKNVPVLPGSNSDSLIAFLPKEEKFVVIRIPYPMGFYPRGLDGRIDDPTKGWKGRALWSTYASGTLKHREGGDYKTELPTMAVKVEMRPHPLAK